MPKHLHNLGFGLGLRPAHQEDIIASNPNVDWFEIISEDYITAGGRNAYYLDKIRERHPVVMHGVSMSLGSCDPLDFDLLKKLKALADRLDTPWISDHLCFTGVNGLTTFDLLPLPYTEEALNHVVERVKTVQDYLERPFLVENVSSYLTYQQSEIPEWEFLREVALRADCLLLFDINNIYVSGYNHGFDPMTYLENIPTDRVRQFHLAGHSNVGHCIIDTHDHDIIPEVWNLYAAALHRFGNVATMIERDDHIPPLTELLQELEQARMVAAKVFPELKS